MNRRSFLKSLLLAPFALVATKVLPKEKSITLAEAVSDNIKTGESVAIADEVTDFTSQAWTPNDINNANFGFSIPENATVVNVRHTFHFGEEGAWVYIDGRKITEAGEWNG